MQRRPTSHVSVVIVAVSMLILKPYICWLLYIKSMPISVIPYRSPLPLNVSFFFCHYVYLFFVSPFAHLPFVLRQCTCNFIRSTDIVSSLFLISHKKNIIQCAQHTIQLLTLSFTCDNRQDTKKPTTSHTLELWAHYKQKVTIFTHIQRQNGWASHIEHFPIWKFHSISHATHFVIVYMQNVYTNEYRIYVYIYVADVWTLQHTSHITG